jgi:Ni/Co efflux regulator RcnB
MKRILVWFLILSFAAVTAARAQDEAAQQQIDKLTGQIQDLQDAQAAQAKHLVAL